MSHNEENVLVSREVMEYFTNNLDEINARAEEAQKLREAAKRRQVMDRVDGLWDIIRYRMNSDLQQENWNVNTLLDTIGLFQCIAEDMREEAQDVGLID